MRRLALVLVTLLALFVLASDVFAASVRGYSRKDGTYVQPHQRTNPDSNPYNNYNYPGNYNPNTGRITGGSQERYLDNYSKRNQDSFGSGNSTRPGW